MSGYIACPSQEERPKCEGIDDTNAFLGYSDTATATGPQPLDFRLADNQQVRVDIVNPKANTFEVKADNPASNFAGVYQNLFITIQ